MIEGGCGYVLSSSLLLLAASLESRAIIQCYLKNTASWSSAERRSKILLKRDLDSNIVDSTSND